MFWTQAAMSQSFNNPMQEAQRTICGAKTRRGAPLRYIANEYGRCRMHGGTSSGAPKGNQNAFKHGRYSAETKRAAAHTSMLMRAFKDMQVSL
jgi:glucans biosynthesis protein